MSRRHARTGGRDGAYGGNKGVKPVTVTGAPEGTGVLDLPVVNH
ncbi:hypothetical protein [Streptomyces kanamyceticus]|nr:hypothetical protein [Streptomyces kanamyceticus]